jgi:hypothetical protein
VDGVDLRRISPSKPAQNKRNFPALPKASGDNAQIAVVFPGYPFVRRFFVPQEFEYLLFRC